MSLNSDDAVQNVAAGRFYPVERGSSARSHRFPPEFIQDPTTPAQYLLGGAYAAKGDLKTARQILESIQPADSQYERAQRLLRKIEESESAAH